MKTITILAFTPEADNVFILSVLCSSITTLRIFKVGWILIGYCYRQKQNCSK